MAFDEKDFRNAKTVNTEKPKAKRFWWLWVLLGVFAVVGITALSMYVRYIRILEVGAQFTEVYWTNLRTSIVAQIASFLIVFVLFAVNNLVIRKIVWREHNDLKIISNWIPMLLVTAVIAFIASRFISESVYTHFLEFANATSFNLTDPLLGQDIGYYMFKRPFIMSVVDSAKVILIIQAVYTVLAYCILYARMGVDSFGDIFKSRSVLVHCFVDIFLIFLCIALTFKFNSENLLYGTFGNNLNGAGYTDTYIWQAYFKCAPIVLLLSVAVTVLMLVRGKIKGAIGGVLLFPAAWVLTAVISLGVQTLVVAPNDIAIESDNICNNILMTRSAYGLDKIKEIAFPLNNTLTQGDLDANAQTVENIRVLDYNSTVTAFNKLQGIKPYYAFKNTDVSAYTMNGKKTTVAIGARELDYDTLATDANDSYVNKTYKYTHGYGVAVSPMNRATVEGQPEFVAKDIPQETDAGFAQISQPRIYYGEYTNHHVIVNTKLKEIDYSEGQTNVDFSYDGAGGIELSGFNRVLFAFLEGDYKMLISGQVTNQSRILTNRNVRERVRSVAPFFAYDENPYMVITEDGRLKWLIDAYTISDQFPYAQNYQGFNYIRNSIKAVVDAYDGTVQFYITDKSDPIALTYQKIYPTLFEAGEMPEDIRAHVRYPEYLFNVQAQMYKKYHITDPHVFYNSSDIWDIAKEKSGEKDTQYIVPYYNMMQLYGLEENGQSLYLTMPFTILNKDYISSYFVAGSDGDSYGQLVSYRFINAEKNAYGTMQMENRIDNDPEISGQMTLWGQGGSNVVRGNMIVVPIKDSLLYVEPVYITTNNTASFPELKRVIVGYKENIVMDVTLRACLSKLFGEDGMVQVQTPPLQEETQVLVPDHEAEPTPSVEDDVLKQVRELYATYKQYNAAGDFENAGKVMAEIDKILTDSAGTVQ